MIVSKVNDMLMGVLSRKQESEKRQGDKKRVLKRTT
jgi:hypothetical protein